jgi:hypothetical protein
MRNGKKTDEGNTFYYKDDKLHRMDGPAIEYTDGTKFWCINGGNHREDGPAVERPDGYKAWYIDDVKYSEEEFIILIRNKKIKKLLESMWNLS